MTTGQEANVEEAAGDAGRPPLQIRRSGLTLLPDRGRVLIRPLQVNNEQPAMKICAQVLADFGERHHQIRNLLEKRFGEVEQFLPTNEKLSEDRRLLIGAYFTHEYSLE